jgi:hypothetical protein
MTLYLLSCAVLQASCWLPAAAAFGPLLLPEAPLRLN